MQGHTDFRSDYPIASHTGAEIVGNSPAAADCEEGAGTILPPDTDLSSPPRLDLQRLSIPQEAYSPAYSLTVLGQDTSWDFDRDSNVSISFPCMSRNAQPTFKESCKRRSFGVSSNYGVPIVSLRRGIISGDDLCSIATQSGTFLNEQEVDLPQDIPDPPQLALQAELTWPAARCAQICDILIKLGISIPHIPIMYWAPLLATNAVHLGLVIGKKYVTEKLSTEVFFPAECGTMLLTACGLVVWSEW